MLLKKPGRLPGSLLQDLRDIVEQGGHDRPVWTEGETMHF